MARPGRQGNTMGSPVVRDAEAGDVPRIAELHRTMGLEMADNAPSGFGETMREQPPLDKIAVEFNEALADEDAILLVAEHGGEVASFLLLAIERHNEDLIKGPFATIQYLATDSNIRGKGLGKLLIGEAENRAKALGDDSQNAMADCNEAIEILGAEIVEIRILDGKKT